MFPRSAPSHGLLFHTWPSFLIDITWLVHTHHLQPLALLVLCWASLAQMGEEGCHRGYTASQRISDSGRWTEVGTAPQVKEWPRRKHTLKINTAWRAPSSPGVHHVPCSPIFRTWKRRAWRDQQGCPQWLILESSSG